MSVNDGYRLAHILIALSLKRLCAMETQLQEPSLLVPSMLDSNIDTQRQRVIECVRRYGGAASAAVLDPANTIFSYSDIDGLIGYRVEWGCAVVFGDPVCAIADRPALTEAFHRYCDNQQLNVIYVTASASFTDWALNHVCHAAIQFGEELSLDPQIDPRDRTGVYASLVRRKVKHALKSGVTASEYLEPQSELQQAMEHVGEEWLKSRRGPQLYISHVHLFDEPYGKRWFYTEHEGKIVGIVVLNELRDRLMMTPDAPNGTPELLVITALNAAREAGSSYVTFGAVPLESVGDLKGVGQITSWLTKHGFKLARKVFNLEGRKKFWEKFHPECEASYLLFGRKHIGIRDIGALMRALNLSL
jgi:lysylphosphatidylglycerol synthetase-like protein (DUF2156 family)